MGQAEDFFSGMEKSEVFGSGEYFEEGSYDVEVQSMILHNGFKGDFFITEFKVLTSNNAACPPGSIRSQTLSMAKERRGNSFSDIKAMIFALMGVDPKRAGKPEDPTAAPLHAEVSTIVKCVVDPEWSKRHGVPQDVFRGRQVHLETFKKATKPKTPGGPPGEYTVHSYSPTPEAAAQRAQRAAPAA